MLIRDTKKQYFIPSNVNTPCEVYGSPSQCHGEANFQLQNKSRSQAGRSKQEDGGGSSRLGPQIQSGGQQVITIHDGEANVDGVDRRGEGTDDFIAAK